MRMRFLYGIRSGDFIKVGVADDIGMRMKAMRLYNPHEPELVMKHTIRADMIMWVEKRAHQLLTEWSIGREWFTCPIETVREAVKAAKKDAIQRERDRDAYVEQRRQAIEDRKARVAAARQEREKRGLIVDSEKRAERARLLQLKKDNRAMMLERIRARIAA